MKLKKYISRPFTTSSLTHQSDLVSNNLVSIDAIKMLHAQLLRTEQHTNPFSISDVIRSYSLSPTTLHKAHLIFRQIERPTLSIWNCMIRGLSLSDRPIDALHMFDEMRGQGFRGSHFTFVSVFKASARVLDLRPGLKVHSHAMKLGCEAYLYVSNALIHMYASCSELGFARKVFDEMLARDLVSWNSLICGYTQCNRFKDVMSLFDAMQEENVKPDAVTMVKVMLACSYLGDMELAEAMVKYIEDNDVKVDVYLGNTLIDMYGRRGSVGLAREVFHRMSEKNTVSWNAMITGYAKAKDLVAAKKVFDEMPKRDVISWSAMITGYSQNKQFANAMELFREMMMAKVKPDEITIASVLSACAHLGTLEVGLAVHYYIRDHNVKADLYIGNSLIDMYCKCGSVEKALEVFREMKEKDSISWASVISGLAVNGSADDALELFSQMLKEGFPPTHGTFIGILLACAHTGLVDKGLEYFESMKKDYGLVPEMKHYGCVVDLLSRSGNLERVYEFIKQMPMPPDIVVWRILLNSCKLHKNVVLAEIATNMLLELDPSSSGTYVLSSNTYADADRWDDAMKLRELMDEIDVQKRTGWSSLEENGEISST